MLHIVDKGSAQSIIQSILYMEQIDIMMSALASGDCVLSGGAVTAQGSPNQTVAVAKGAVLTNGVLKAFAASASTAITAADATNPRLDLVVITSSGAIAVRTGTAAAAPKPPVRTANDVALAMIYVPANDATIDSTAITDMRIIRTQGPLTIYKTTTAESTDTTSSAFHILNKTGSGVSIPSGLFLAGKIIRCRIGGEMTMNSGTPTLTLIIMYGGTTMFSDVTSTGWSADTDHRAWFIEFDLVAAANAVQALAGTYAFQAAAAYTGAATGLGDIGNTSEQVGPIHGTAAVDSDAADRTLTVTMTLSVSNAADQVIVRTASLELL